MKKSAASLPADMTQTGEIGWRMLEGLNEKLMRDPTGKQVLIDQTPRRTLPAFAVGF